MTVNQKRLQQLLREYDILTHKIDEVDALIETTVAGPSQRGLRPLVTVRSAMITARKFIDLQILLTQQGKDYALVDEVAYMFHEQLGTVRQNIAPTQGDTETQPVKLAS